MNGRISTLGPIAVGQHVTLMRGSKTNVRERTARVARQIVKRAGFDLDDGARGVRGALSFMCAVNYYMGGDEAMQATRRHALRFCLVSSGFVWFRLVSPGFVSFRLVPSRLI